MYTQILIIITGGTIDSAAYEKATPDSITPLDETIVPEAVEELNLDTNCRFLEWAMKDSKEFSEKDFKKLAEEISRAAENHIIITHGTDAMAENSRSLKKLLGKTDKTVLFTGSMIPLSHGKESDGHNNLQYAINNICSFKPGVYVAMHNELFNPDSLRKDFKNLRFYVGERSETAL